MLVDTHCHLSDKKFKDNLNEVIEKALKVGVGKVIVPSTNLEDAKRVIELVEANKSTYALVGIHPEHVEEIERIGELKALVGSSKKVVGIGEIGLDFYFDKEKKTKPEQIKLFKSQLELARELGLPTMIHNRVAEKEMVEVIESMSKLPKGQFHCWSADSEFLEYVLKKGFYVSFCGNITYKGNDELRDLLKEVPLDKLLLETDSPYLPPEPLRGRINEPRNVKITAEFIANVLNVSLDTLINQTTKNSLCLYCLEDY
jgi:TatD DNase family protein